MIESELLSYRLLPSTPACRQVFDLAAQHPGAPMVTQAGVGPSSRG